MRVLCRRTNKEYTKYCVAYSLFQSTSSVWRTTITPCDNKEVQHISIHVLRVEDDAIFQRGSPSTYHFNPRPPCGGRQRSACRRFAIFSFQSTSSVWRTTESREMREADFVISIHVLRVEDDLSVLRRFSTGLHFNPRPPCGGRPEAERDAGLILIISIHVLHVEDDPSGSKYSG